MEDKKRIYLFDNLKCVLIFLVVFFHMFEIIRNDTVFNKGLYFFIYVFHMPLFIFISGYFYNRKKIIENIRKYIILYTIFQGLYLIYLEFILVKEDEVSFYNIIFIEPQWILWYLVSMIFYNIFAYPINDKIIKDKKIVWLILFFFIILSAVVGYVNKIGKILSMSRNIVFFPYFLMGYFVRQNYDILEIKNSYWDKEKRLVKVLCLLFAILIMCGYIGYLFFNVAELKPEVVFNNKPYRSSGSNPIIRTLLYLPAFSMIFLNLLLVPNKEYKIITKVGANTLYIFLFHGFLDYYLDMHKGLIQNLPNELAKYIVILLITIAVISVICIVKDVLIWIKTRINNKRKEEMV